MVVCLWVWFFFLLFAFQLLVIVFPPYSILFCFLVDFVSLFSPSLLVSSYRLLSSSSVLSHAQRRRKQNGFLSLNRKLEPTKEVAENRDENQRKETAKQRGREEREKMRKEENASPFPFFFSSSSSPLLISYLLLLLIIKPTAPSARSTPPAAPPKASNLPFVSMFVRPSVRKHGKLLPS